MENTPPPGKIFPHFPPYTEVKCPSNRATELSYRIINFDRRNTIATNLHQNTNLRMLKSGTRRYVTLKYIYANVEYGIERIEL